MSSSGRRSSVAQTCNLLSHYFKENGRFANQGVETMNLLPNLENSAEISRQNVKANDFLTNIPSLASSNSKNDDMLEHGSSQMTIFYAGQVFVFSDFSAEKAKEIMALATKAAASNSKVTPGLDLNVASTSDNNNNDIVTPDCFHNQSYQAVPIARRASLHRFFEKRKDRVTSRAPYQVNIPSPMAAAAAKPDDQSKCSWMELEGQSSSEQFDLNLLV